MKLTVKNLSVNLNQKEILKNISLEIESGKLHVLMGPNGSGKSTLAQALMGNPNYELKSKNYELRINGRNIKDFKTDERAREGLFLAFQNPTAIPGVSVANLLKMAYQFNMKEKTPRLRSGQASKHNPALSVWEFNELLLKICQELGIPREFLRRSLNEEFSGGEKKKLETLQAVILQPKYAIFDEIDTGLDVDALRIVATTIDRLKRQGCGVLVITHYQRILRFARPDFVHILMKGRIIESGDYRLAEEIEKNGYKKWMS